MFVRDYLQVGILFFGLVMFGIGAAVNDWLSAVVILVSAVLLAFGVGEFYDQSEQDGSQRSVHVWERPQVQEVLPGESADLAHNTAEELATCRLEEGVCGVHEGHGDTRNLDGWLLRTQGVSPQVQSDLDTSGDREVCATPTTKPFDVTVRAIHLEPHPNADRLEIGAVPGQTYQFIVQKGAWTEGQLGVYIPEQAIVPETLLQEMGLVGALGGADKNRVKAVKLRGLLSQGLFYRPEGEWPEHWVEGLNVAGELGIEKWEPNAPSAWMGTTPKPNNYVYHPGGTYFHPYTDIENLKKYPDAFSPGEIVCVSEKLHGTCLMVGISGQERFVSSLGVARRNHASLPDEPGNIYWEAARKYRLFERLSAWMEMEHIEDAILYGEIVGVQDLRYNVDGANYNFYGFDIMAMRPAKGFIRGGYENGPEVVRALHWMGVPIVPTLYVGPYDADKIATLSTGDSTLAPHVREGAVIRPVTERFDHRFGRVILKSINADYLTRRGGTEYH